MTLTVTVTATVTQDGRGPRPHVDDDEDRRPFCVSAAVTVTAYVTDSRARRPWATTVPIGRGDRDFDRTHVASNDAGLRSQ